MADGGGGRLRSLGGNLKEEFKKSDLVTNKEMRGKGT